MDATPRALLATTIRDATTWKPLGYVSMHRRKLTISPHVWIPTFPRWGGANNSVIWSSRPHLGCGTDIATWCTDSMLAKCVGAATKMQQYVTLLSDANLTSPWILNYVPTFVCEHTDVQLSSASRRFVLF